MLSRKKVEKALLKIGIPAGYMGFRCIADAMMLLDKPEWNKPKFSLMYDEIGAEYGKNGASVERAIRYVLKTATNGKDDSDIIWRYVGRSKRSNTNMLMALYSVLSNECKDDLSDEIRNEMPDSMESLRDLIRQEIRNIICDAFTEGI